MTTIGWVGTGSPLVQGELVRFVRAVGPVPTGTVGCLVGFNTFASCFVRVTEPQREIHEVPVAVLEPLSGRGSRAALRTFPRPRPCVRG